MEPIKIINNTTDLDGTCYIELSLGRYSGNHWAPSSLYFAEEIFGFIEPIFEKHIQNYNHYGINNPGVNEWNKITSALSELANFLRSVRDFEEVLGHIGFMFGDVRDYFQRHFNTCQRDLIQLIGDVIEWVNTNLPHHRYIAILGI
ncbi:hypothetical protein [Kordiimonas sp. SCSIO 12610]|uniref:hypothetical protein n=1 Tax=Kordiimonas sp. SCSIO 12610 TaxID=2829597 RepID=UPI0021096AFD|nr:hypothetical protein [Kordiimonas sp. SCSIO 12610]UTW54392.1 hypothetical protein KFF44_11260 [Kordiimonas sp. SCSIO 12610]